jgi:hypothetical protein
VKSTSATAVRRSHLLRATQQQYGATGDAHALQGVNCHQAHRPRQGRWQQGCGCQGCRSHRSLGCRLREDAAGNEALPECIELLDGFGGRRNLWLLCRTAAVRAHTPAQLSSLRLRRAPSELCDLSSGCRIGGRRPAMMRSELLPSPIELDLPFHLLHFSGPRSGKIGLPAAELLDRARPSGVGRKSFWFRGSALGLRTRRIQLLCAGRNRWWRLRSARASVEHEPALDGATARALEGLTLEALDCHGGVGRHRSQLHFLAAGDATHQTNSRNWGTPNAPGA